MFIEQYYIEFKIVCLISDDVKLTTQVVEIAINQI